MDSLVRLGIGLLTTSLAGWQIGYHWSFEELAAKADLVVIAEPVRTDDTGRRTEHPNLKPGLPVLELVTTLKVVAVLKADRSASNQVTQVRLKHFQVDRSELVRRSKPNAGGVPGGLVNAGSYLDFSRDTGTYLLFLVHGTGDVYEPVSGHTFPTTSVYALQEFRRPAG